jgi:hypothetical protein
MPMFKYIIFEDQQANQHLRIFDALWEGHVDIRNAAPTGWTVVGAGEFRCNQISCIHKSVSLAMPFSAKRTDEDTELVKRLYEIA